MHTTTKNKWKSSLIDKHYKNQHNARYGSHRRYGSSLYDCPCCVGLSEWKRVKKKSIRCDVNTQQTNAWNDSDIFINDINDINDDIEYISKWQCTQCTFINLNSTSFCAVCNKPFDYNYQNNFHYKQQETIIIIQYKSKKKNKNKRKIITKNNNKKLSINIETDILLPKDENYMIEAEKYRLCKKSKRKKNQCSKQAKAECFELFDIEISVITTNYNEYEYIEDKLCDDLEQQLFWINVPMKLINTKLRQCSLKIIPKNKQKAKCVYFQPKISDFFVPIYLTKYLFIYKHDLIPKLLENHCLFRIIKHCLNQWNVRNITFNHNLSTISFNLEPILFEYIPSKDILKNLLFPFIGYNQALCIKTNIKNVKINKNVFKLSSNDDEINFIDNKYKSALHHISMKTKKQSDDNKLVDDNSDSSQDSIPLFFKHLNDDNHTDSSSETIQNTEDNDDEHVLFKPPYKYGKHSNLTDDDDKRDIKWWKDVQYKNKKRIKRKYKVNDKIEVRMCGNEWRSAKVIESGANGIKIKYDECRWGSQDQEFIGKLLYQSKVKLISVYDRKRKAYSKSNTIHYFAKNGR